jgi:TolB protein
MLRTAAAKIAWVGRTAAMVFCLALVSLPAITSTPAEAASSAKDGRIVFTSDRTMGPGVHNPTGDFEIFTVDRNSKNPKQLTFNTVIDEYPAYSPDGKHIAFSTDRDGNDEVYEMKANGSNPTNLTNHPLNDLQSAYSPDGEHIAFTSRRDGNYEVYEMRADGSDQTNLTNDPSHDYGPAYSPDGKRIAFVSIRDTNEEVYEMRTDGSDQTNLTNAPASYDYEPAWHPG